MDHYGIGNAIKGIVGAYAESARRTGRTTSLVESVKDGDRVIFTNGREADRVKRLCAERGVERDGARGVRVWYGPQGDAPRCREGCPIDRETGVFLRKMGDLVATCPKDFWDEWIAEGDAAGAPETGTEWGWFTRHRLISEIGPGDRLYVVAHGKLRGYAPVTRVHAGAICRRGNAVACTIDEPIPGFRGLRRRWWDRSIEKPFPDWTTP